MSVCTVMVRNTVINSSDNTDNQLLYQLLFAGGKGGIIYACSSMKDLAISVQNTRALE